MLGNITLFMDNHWLWITHNIWKWSILYAPSMFLFWNLFFSHLILINIFSAFQLAATFSFSFFFLVAVVNFFLKPTIRDEQVCSAETNDLMLFPQSLFHMLFRWMQIGHAQRASEHGLGSVPNFKLCTCPLSLPYPQSAKQHREKGWWDQHEDASLCATDSCITSVRL